MIDRDLDDANAIEKAFIEACIRHNQHQAGEKNRLQPLINFQYGVGFVFEKDDGTLWKIESVLPRNQRARVLSLDGKFSELWHGARMVKLPSHVRKI